MLDEKNMTMKLSIIGAGAMGGAIADGIVRNGMANTLTVSNPHADKLERFAQAGASVTTDNQAAAEDADVVMVVVKPWLVEKVLGEIKDVMDYRHQLLVVVAAGVSSEAMIKWLNREDAAHGRAATQNETAVQDGRVPVLFLAMPNIAIAERESMTFLSSPNASKEQLNTIAKLFDALGQTLVIEERLFPAATAMSCSIAYAMRYVRANTEGAVELGFRAREAQKLVLQTVRGAVALLQATGEHPEAAIDKVTTPGGWTIRGLNAMEQAGFTSAVIQGLKAPVR